MRWDLESVKKVASGLSSEELKKKHKGAWGWAQRNNKLEEVCPKRQRKSSYSLREISVAQRKYASRSQLDRKDSPLYSWLNRRGLLDGFFPASGTVSDMLLDANGEARHDKEMARFIAVQRRSGIKCNITNEDWIRHLNTNNCDVCGTSVSSKKDEGRNKHFDHCHDTGKYRGTLCHQCNVAEGMLKTKENVKKLLDYLMDRCV